MMRFSVTASIFCLGALFAHPAFSVTEDQQAAIIRLGVLNGIALQCRYFEQMKRIKLTLVAHLPKRRELGLLFEDATNKSFLSFMHQDATCPGSADFVNRVDAAAGKLESAFSR